MSNVCLCVFTKSPVPGQVKTRLLPVLTAEQACDVHKKLLNHCVSQVQHADWQCQLWSTDVQHTYIRELAQRHAMSLHRQKGEDLGDKMRHAVNQSLINFSYVILIGSDCPSIDVKLVSAAIKSLQTGNEVVLAPADDGGYVLIGMSIGAGSLFNEIEWGTDQVLTITRERLALAGVRWHELEMQRDIDRPEDLIFLQQQYPELFIQ